MDDFFSILNKYKYGSAPIDIYKLIVDLGIGIVETILDDDISGTIERKKSGQYLISINSSDSQTRKRFTAAHELGHYIYHREQIDEQCIADNRLYRSTDNSKYNAHIGKLEETQANQFAANLLMPLHLIKELKESGLSIDEIATALGVSKQAMKIRYDAILGV